LSQVSQKKRSKILNLFLVLSDVLGIYRANPVRVNTTRRAILSIYKTYIDVIHYKVEENEASKLGDDRDTAEAESQDMESVCDSA
jgi:DNA replication licensing factor MCM4